MINIQIIINKLKIHIFKLDKLKNKTTLFQLRFSHAIK